MTKFKQSGYWNLPKPTLYELSEQIWATWRERRASLLDLADISGGQWPGAGQPPPAASGLCCQWEWGQPCRGLSPGSWSHCCGGPGPGVGSSCLSSGNWCWWSRLTTGKVSPGSSHCWNIFHIEFSKNNHLDWQTVLVLFPSLSLPAVGAGAGVAAQTRSWSQEHNLPICLWCHNLDVILTLFLVPFYFSYEMCFCLKIRYCQLLYLRGVNTGDVTEVQTQIFWRNKLAK